MPMEPPAFTVRDAALDEIMALRQAVLLPGRPADEARFDGDADLDTRHVGAFAGGLNVGCASCMAAPYDGADAWQLRGMATHPDWRGRGVGRDLLRYLEASLGRATPGRTVWCNARIGAVGFYEKHGWRVTSEQFLIEGVGPHFRMVRAGG